MHPKIKKITFVILLLSLFVTSYMHWLVFSSTLVLNVRIPVSRAMVTFFFGHLFVVGIVFNREVIALLRRYFGAVAFPLNLAVFRIGYFAYLLFEWHFEKGIRLAGDPAGVRVAPDGLGWVLDTIPITETWMIVATTLFQFFCFLSMIGLFSRLSTWGALIFGFYALGAPQFVGKLYHIHHIIWFMAILATSRCGDALSVDAIIKGWRQGGRGRMPSLKAENYYALPLRIIWVLIGILYFFPGFQKIWYGGLDWFLSGNLKNYLYYKWFQFPNWQPPFRIDKYPFLFKSAAFGVLFFELSFVFLIFPRRLRWLAVGMGLFFHNMTNLFMRIPFRSLLNAYIVFFDWHAIFHWLGKRLYRQDITLVYNGQSRAACRLAAILQVFDILGRIRYVPRNDSGTVSVQGKGQEDTGFLAARWIFLYIPFFWILLPFTFIWPFSKICRTLFESLGGLGSRVFSSRVPEEPALAPCKTRVPYAVIVMGSILILGNIYCGARNIHSWPFSAYPPFSELRLNAYVAIISLEVYDGRGQEIPLPKRLPRHYTGSRYRAVMNEIMWALGEEKEERLKGLWQLWQQNNPQLQPARNVKFYWEIITTHPDKQPDNSVEKVLIYEIVFERGKAFYYRR